LTKIAQPWPALARCRRDPDVDQETCLIHYDDIRVGSILSDKDQWSRRVRFFSHRIAVAFTADVRCAP
jgi:hypothetical protein